jgi:hypothetical protein
MSDPDSDPKNMWIRIRNTGKKFSDSCVPYLDGGTLELPEEGAVVAEHGHMEPVSVAVANQNVAGI